MPTQYTHRVILALEALKQNPAPVPEYDVKKLQGLKDTYRIRIGDIRIIYQIVWESKRIKILTIESRGRAYR
jgi:mRNA interferase RelE/StbE